MTSLAFTPMRKLQATVARKRQLLAAEESISRAHKVLQGHCVAVRREFYSGSQEKPTARHRRSNVETIVLVCGKFRYLPQVLPMVQRAFARFSERRAFPGSRVRPGRTF